MSSTGRGARRAEADFYRTPEWAVWAVLDHPKFKRSLDCNLDAPIDQQRWLEPCVGDGAIIRACAQKQIAPRWDLIDVRSDPYLGYSLHAAELEIAEAGRRHSAGCRAWTGQNFLKWTPPGFWDKGWQKYDLCLTNPPFGLAQKFIERSLVFSYQVIMLLRLNYLGSAERVRFHQRRPADLYVIGAPRIGFTPNGQTDSIEYAWFSWPGTGELVVIDAREHEQHWQKNHLPPGWKRKRRLSA